MGRKNPQSYFGTRISYVQLLSFPAVRVSHGLEKYTDDEESRCQGGPPRGQGSLERRGHSSWEGQKKCSYPENENKKGPTSEP